MKTVKLLKSNSLSFLKLTGVKEAKEKAAFALHYAPKTENVSITDSIGRVTTGEIFSKADIPPFDRAGMDGYACRAEDTYGAEEDKPVTLRVVGEVSTGHPPKKEVRKGECCLVSTGSAMPRGANCVVMTEYCTRDGHKVRIIRACAPGENIGSCGSDFMAGEKLLRDGERITSRECALLAAAGIKTVRVYRKPKVGIISLGDELVPAGKKLTYGKIYDINSSALVSAVKESGGEPIFLGVVKDKPALIGKAIERAARNADIILTSGSTSKGVGDTLCSVLEKEGEVLVHGIKIKPGKPTIIGSFKKRLFFGLPGYPSSCLTIFTHFVRPLIRKMAQLPPDESTTIEATLGQKLFSEPGITQFQPVYLVHGKEGLVAYPNLKGSGAISSLSDSDGYTEIPEYQEIVQEGEKVKVTLFSNELRIPDITIIGSNCPALGIISKLLLPLRTRIISVGSSGGLEALARGEADAAGSHLLDPETSTYNIPYLKRFGLEGKAVVVRGYGRKQGILFRKGAKIKSVRNFRNTTIINRNKGSGTRVLLDMELKKAGIKPAQVKGYELEAKTHSAVGSAVANGRADAGIALEYTASVYDLGFIPLRDEEYDFIMPKDRINRDIIKILKSEEFRKEIAKLKGYRTYQNTGEIIYTS